MDFNTFKQTHGQQKLEKPKKKKKKLFKVRHSTNPYREEHTKLKGFENLKKIQKIIYKYNCAVWDSKFGFGLNIVNIYDESITITITSAGLSKVEK